MYQNTYEELKPNTGTSKAFAIFLYQNTYEELKHMGGKPYMDKGGRIRIPMRN